MAGDVRHGAPALTDRLLAPLWRRSPAWPLLFALSGAGALTLFGMLALTALAGIGLWNINIPVAWGFGIVNFTWWMGLAHAGTFVSAVLFLTGHTWRTSIHRLAEAATLFAVANAAVFPIIHLGRPWFAYWLAPYPSTLEVWPQYKSVLPWDATSVLTYAVVSLVFWYLGMLPDLAAARDHAPTLRGRRVYGALALGWRGSSTHWHQYRALYGVVAGLAAILVVSTESIVAWDFATAQIPGWHLTVFPPYFVLGGIYGGFALVLGLVVPLRWAFHLEDLVTRDQLARMATILLAGAWVVIYRYVVEAFVAWYSGSRYEIDTFLRNRPFGTYAVVYWAMLAATALVPQLFWWRRPRTNGPVLFLVAVVVLAGVWGERFLVVVTSLERDFLPSAWHHYVPSWVEWLMFAGTFGLFVLLVGLTVRFVPIVHVSALKAVGYEQEVGT